MRTINCERCKTEVKTSSNNRKYCNKCIKETDYLHKKKWEKNNLEKNRATNRKWGKVWSKNNQDKVKAHRKVNQAILRGDISSAKLKECVDCGLKAEEYHHNDYSKALEVIPLCRKCHKKEHKEELSQ